MTIALLLISDGRDDYLARTLDSIAEKLPDLDEVVHVDDRDHKLGFAGAIAEGWDRVRATGADWVWHQEQDFTYDQPVPVPDMRELLERHPEIAQVSLKRQSWNAEEHAAGGIIERAPDSFTEQRDGDRVWTEHRLYFTTNPSLYSARLCWTGWPQEPRSEGVFTHKLLTDPLLKFAIWGGKHDPPRCTHIGATRDGLGY